jgi:nucleoside 2-deoxyribosyltransferase
VQNRAKLYLASPLFSAIERTENRRICCALERWCDVFLPQRDGELVLNLIEQGLPQSKAYRIVFDRDVAALRACDALVINLDGRVVDEGAAFELGCAYALGKRCVGYRTDVRVLLPWGLNPMVSVPLDETFTSIAALAAWAREFRVGASLPNLRVAQ